MAVAGAEVGNPRQDFDRIWDAGWQQHVLAAALAAVKRRVRPEQYAIHHLLAIEEWTRKNVARISRREHRQRVTRETPCCWGAEEGSRAAGE